LAAFRIVVPAGTSMEIGAAALERNVILGIWSLWL
jgi:hypothetical protein